jgi:hypothetical protein
VRRVRRTGEVKIGGGMAFISMALDGELVGLEEILDGIWACATAGARSASSTCGRTLRA